MLNYSDYTFTIERDANGNGVPCFVTEANNRTVTIKKQRGTSVKRECYFFAIICNGRIEFDSRNWWEHGFANPPEARKAVRDWFSTRNTR